MPIITWTESMSVGVKEFDGHHKRLIEYINQLHDAMSQGKGQKELEPILNGLVDYTVMHFSSEEKMMIKYGYPELTAHRAAHDWLTQKVVDFQTQFKKNGLGLSVKLSAFLKDWLTGHIMKEDQQYSAFFLEKGV